MRPRIALSKTGAFAGISAAIYAIMVEFVGALNARFSAEDEGVVTLVNGVADVPCSIIRTNPLSLVSHSRREIRGVAGLLEVPPRYYRPGIGFKIISNSVTDQSVVVWKVVNA